MADETTALPKLETAGDSQLAGDHLAPGDDAPIGDRPRSADERSWNGIEVTGSPAAQQGQRRRLFRSRSDVLAILPAGLIALAVLAAIFPIRSGPPAFLLVLEPQLFIAVAVVLAPFAILGRARTLAFGLVVAVATGGVLFGSEWVSLPGAAAGRHDLSVLSWNVEFGSRTPADQAAQLEGVTADLVDLLELEPDAAQAIENDPILTARYPYRAVAARDAAWGVGILSRFPISNVVSIDDPATMDFIVTTPQGKVHVIAAHPRPADITTITRFELPIDYDPSARDAAIAKIRTRIDAALAAGDRLLVVGDFNTSPYEAEYSVLTAGLRDTHVQVGEGPGWTWRPNRLTFLPIGLLRIDLQLTAGSIYPTSTSIDCSLPGDHCRLFGDYEID